MENDQNPQTSKETEASEDIQEIMPRHHLMESIRLYQGALFDIARYEVTMTFITGVMVFCLSHFSYMLIRSTGRYAITTGDFDFLFKTWQGPVLIIVGLTVLFIYFAADLNTRIIYASDYLRGSANLRNAIRKGSRSITSFLTPDGIGIVLYISLIAPIIGFGFTISLTESLYIPDFIFSVINDNTVYYTLYLLFVIGFIFIGVINIFTIHGVVLDGYKSHDADNVSRQLMKKNWKNFIYEHIMFLLGYGATIVILGFTLLLVPLFVEFSIIENEDHIRIAVIFTMMLSFSSIFFISGCFKSFYLLKITQLYYKYSGKPYRRRFKRNRKKTALIMLGCVLFTALLYLSSYVLGMNFDEIFRTDITTGVIAHRAGGTEAPENTAAGIDKAYEFGAEGSEIDIQRTKDGHYIVNHDSNFSRLCGNKSKPEDLTLEEVKQLVITDPRFPDDPTPVNTFEEMLDASKGKVILFVELKGNTADIQMAEDAVRIIKEKDMVDDTVIISLKYNLISYIETNYPEMNTGYLLFASIGQIGNLNCDYVGLEEEAASGSNIDALHNAGKKVMVWTPNKKKSQKHFFLSEADFIITDQIAMADELIEELENREDIEILFDVLRD